ncbi:MAG: ATP-dependent helicase HepA, partial [Cellvibrionaceae bacterium]
MENPKIGQRWLVDTDSTLGLGMLVECQARQIVLEFPAMGERRIYSRENAPLTRAVFDPGDLITTIDGEDYVVAKVDEVDGLLIYTDQTGHLIPESQLASSLSLNHPLKRLLSGQLDNPRWFYVRETLARGLQSWQRSGLQGLIGCRITLTPYQLYVAHSATSRSPVRVLLADEVGLGKTIEAGLILQRLQYQGSVRRTLILVPESLCVQWFVELMRCFSIPGVLVSEHTALEDSRVFIAPHSMIANASLLEA